MTIFDKPGTDAWYEALRDPEGIYELEQAARFAQLLYDRTHAYLDGNLLRDLPDQFHQRFWEMYLVNLFLEIELPAVPTSDRRHQSPGPDIQIGVESAWWVEATAVTPGTGQNQVPESVPGQMREVPDTEIKLRITQALSDKRRQYDRHIKNQTVCPDEPYVIAINAGLLPTARKEQTLPRIAKVTLGVGSEVALLSPTEPTEYFHEAQVTLPKHTTSGTVPICSAFFENPNNNVISAVFFSANDVANAAAFYVVPNPYAENPLPMFPFGVHFSRNGEQILWQRHPGYIDNESGLLKV